MQVHQAKSYVFTPNFTLLKYSRCQSIQEQRLKYIILKNSTENVEIFLDTVNGQSSFLGTFFKVEAFSWAFVQTGWSIGPGPLLKK